MPSAHRTERIFLQPSAYASNMIVMRAVQFHYLTIFAYSAIANAAFFTIRNIDLFYFVNYV